MELQFYGANAIKVSTKKFSIVVDDNLLKLGLKEITKPTDLSLRTNLMIPEHAQAVFSAEMPGEYEISGAIIHGIAAKAHMDEEGKTTATMYTIEAEDSRVAIVGHIFPDLSEEQLEDIGSVDVLLVPVGGNGYTLDGAGALSIVKKIEPKYVISTHYAEKALKFEVPQADLSEAHKGLAMEPSETVDKYKIRPGEPADTTRLVVLKRQ